MFFAIQDSTVALDNYENSLSLNLFVFFTPLIGTLLSKLTETWKNALRMFHIFNKSGKKDSYLSLKR